MRTRRPPLKLARDRLSTIAWIHAVRAAAAIKDGVPPDADPLTLQKALVRKHRREFRSFHRSHRIRNYFRGEPAPDPSTLQLLERLYTGTREVFEHGPDRSYLWDAIFCRDLKSAESTFFKLKHDIQQGVLAERRVRQRPGSKRRRLEQVVIPDSLARPLGLIRGKSLDALSAELAKRLKKNHRLGHSFSRYLDGEDPLHVEGPLVQLIPDVTFSAESRRRENAFVRPSALAGLALQILHAKINGQIIVTLEYWIGFFIAWRLVDFGVSEKEVERLSGLRFRTGRAKAQIVALRRFRRAVKRLAAGAESPAVSTP